MANTIKLTEKFDLEITVRKGSEKELENILLDNEWAFNAVTLMFNNLVEFTVYAVGFAKVEALKKLMKDKGIKYY